MNLLFSLFYTLNIKNSNKLYFELGGNYEIIKNNKTINHKILKNKFNDCALIPYDKMPKNNFLEYMKK